MSTQHTCTAPWADGEITIDWYWEPADPSCGSAGGAVVEDVHDVDTGCPWWPDRIKRNLDELEALAVACTEDAPEDDADLKADLAREDAR